MEMKNILSSVKMALLSNPTVLRVAVLLAPVAAMFLLGSIPGDTLTGPAPGGSGGC